MRNDVPEEKNEAKAKRPSVEKRSGRKRVSTEIIDDVFTDVIAMVKPRFKVDYDAYLGRLWESNPEIHEILKKAPDLETARDGIYSYLERAERAVFDTAVDLHILEKGTVRECVRAFKSIIGPINEYRTGVSALDCLWRLAQGKHDEDEISVGFLMEFINLFRGVAGESYIYQESSGSSAACRSS